jgi:hypothetical protein
MTDVFLYEVKDFARGIEVPTSAAIFELDFLNLFFNLLALLFSKHSELIVVEGIEAKSVNLARKLNRISHLNKPAQGSTENKKDRPSPDLAIRLVTLSRSCLAHAN